MNKQENDNNKEAVSMLGKEGSFKVGLDGGQSGCLSEGERECLFQEEGPKAENDREPTVERFIYLFIYSFPVTY